MACLCSHVCLLPMLSRWHLTGWEKTSHWLKGRINLSVDDICDLLSFCFDAIWCFRAWSTDRSTEQEWGHQCQWSCPTWSWKTLKQTALYTFHTHTFSGEGMCTTCTALPRDLGDSFHQHLNSVGPNIQFTVQKVKDGQLPYLDILLIWGLRWLHQHFTLPKSNTQISTSTSSHTNWWLTSRQLSGLWSAGVKVFLHQKWGK